MSNFPKDVIRDLKKYSPLEPYPPESKEYRNLLMYGLIEPQVKLDHDEVCHWLLAETEKANKESVVNAFLCGLALDEPQMRCALPAYAYAYNFKNHDFRKAHDQAENCAVCANYSSDSYDLTFLQRCRWSGSLVGSTPLVGMAALYLQAHRNSIGYVEEVDEHSLELGEKILSDILNVVAACDENETPSKLVKRIRAVGSLKLTNDAAKSLIESLGYAGVLHPKDHPSWINQFIEGVLPRKTHSSDWAYPVDFWVGSDGVNEDALLFWFGEDFKKNTRGLLKGGR